jgi:AAA family ATP:ADP antiporter
MQIINRIFNLRPGDFARGLPLFAYYFLIITFYQIGRVARVAIFLDHFKPAQQPYADMSVALLGGFIIALYIRTGRRLSLRGLQLGSLLFFAANLVALWWGLQFYKSAWLAPVFYFWVGVCGILAVAQVWTLANFVWTTREAKRLFGVFGSGGIIGGSFGGFFGAWIALRYGAESILLFMAGFLLICAVLVPIIYKQKRVDSNEPNSTDSEESPRNLAESFRLVRQSKHLQTIAGLICLSSVATAVAGWQLNAIAKETLVQKNAVAHFLGDVQGYTGLLALIVQLLLTSKILRRFGVGVSLLVLPLSLTLGSLTVAIWGTLWAAAVLRGSDTVPRYSLDTSALQLLYLPVPGKIKVQVKSFTDTVVKNLGDGLAALTVLLFATTLHLSARQISWVNFVLLGAWIATAIVARRNYVETLRENIQHVAIRPDQISIQTLDQSASNMLAEKLNSSDPNEVLYALDLFEMGQKVQSHSAIRRLIEHPSAHVRKKAVAVLNSAGDRSVRGQVASLLRDSSVEVRTEALTYLTRHDHVDPVTILDKLHDFEDYSVCSATAAFLAKPGEGQNLEAAKMILDRMIHEHSENAKRMRLEAVRLIPTLPDAFEPQLEALLQEKDSDILCAAYQAAAALRKRQFVPQIIEGLANLETAADAGDALTLFEDAVVGDLQHRLNDQKERMEIRLKIPNVLFRIGTPAAVSALMENLTEPDPPLRLRIISALNKLQDLRRNLNVEKDMIETMMIAELIGHYRSYQILGVEGGVPDEELQQSMRAELERIFRLMKLLFPSLDLQNAYAGIHSSDPVMHSNALEFLDNTLNTRLRTLIVPLLDSEVTIKERIHLADQFLGFSAKA